MREGKIKILTNNADLTVVVNQIKLFEGVTSVSLSEDILSYYLDEWASDYDVMVAITNALTDAGVDSEPFFDEDDEFIVNVSNNEETVDEESEDEEGEREHDHEHDDDEDCCHHHYYEEGFLKAKKGKLIELGVALLIFIVGLIFSGISSLTKVAPYVMIVAYSVTSYEILFEGVTCLFKKKFFNEQLLMVIASIAAIALGETAEAVGIVMLFNIGELFEGGAINSSRKSLAELKKSRPDKVTVINESGNEIKIKAEAVEIGSVVIYKAGDKIAVDGVIIEGKTNLDTKTITGESVYKTYEEGSEVFGGYVVIDGAIKVKTTKLYSESAVSKIVEIVESSSENKSNSEKFVTNFAKYYTPIVVILAVLLAVVPPFFYETYSVGFNIWLKRAVMMLCVSCPCALVISVPLSYFCAVGNAAKNGVLIKTTERLSLLSKCKTFAFDKTGTLTTGEFTVSKIVSTKKFAGKVLAFAAICEKNSAHPIAKSIIKKHNESIDEATDYKEIAGRGVSCNYQGKTLICGNYKFMEESGVSVKEITELGVKLYVAYDKEFVGVIVLNDTPRDTAYGAIMELYDEGVENTVMLTGDNKEYASVMRKQLNMRQSVSELLPEDKVTEIENLIGENNNVVAFVGDGINDAPVLSRADVGIAMGGLGSDLAVESADMVIVDDDLSKVPYLLKLAKRTDLIVKQNVIGSIAIKLLVMILGIIGVTSSIWLAIGADVGVMILAILNAIRLK